MLTFYGSEAKGAIPGDMRSGQIPPQANWIDAVNPTAEETAFLARALGIRIPTRADLEEIESSSRLATDGEAILMSLPATLRDEEVLSRTTPIGFVVTRDRVLTLRFALLPSFEGLTRRLSEQGAIAPGGLGATITILEIIIDHVADALELLGSDLDSVSRGAFARDMIAARTQKARQTNESLKMMLQTVGRSGELGSKMSETLLGLSRMVPYLASHAASYMTPDYKSRLDTLGQDAKSLHDYEEHLSNKAQFLLDTLLGLTNIEQNNVFRLLTVVSVIGIPPTFFASMWGMNFKSMPELDWPHGYAMGLSVMAISAILPALWFKAKGWL